MAAEDEDPASRLSLASDSFLGTGWSFPPTFLPGAGTVQMVSDEADVEQSLRILLTTEVGERLLRPEYGCDLRRYVFEPIDVSLEAYLADLVRSAILLFEPRVFPQSVRVSGSEGSSGYEDGQLLIEVEYLVRSTNSRHNYVFPFYKDEGRDVSP